MKRRSFAPTETDECIAFVEWAKWARYRGRPVYERLVKIPNERGKAGAHIVYLERMGMKKGFPDYVLFLPLAPYAGLVLEAKRRKGGAIAPEQIRWRDDLISFGYHAEICRGADELIDAVRRYMRLADPREWRDAIPANRPRTEHR